MKTLVRTIFLTGYFLSATSFSYPAQDANTRVSQSPVFPAERGWKWDVTIYDQIGWSAAWLEGVKITLFTGSQLTGNIQCLRLKMP